HIADLAELLDVLAVPEATLVGNSFGGLLALAFAAQHPDRVAGIVLCDGHLGDDAFAEQMTATLRLEGEARDQRIAECFASWLGRNSQRKSNRLADNARALVERTSLVRDLGATPPLGVAALREVSAPVLALYGERSDLRTRAEASLTA